MAPIGSMLNLTLLGVKDDSALSDPTLRCRVELLLTQASELTQDRFAAKEIAAIVERRKGFEKPTINVLGDDGKCLGVLIQATVIREAVIVCFQLVGDNRGLVIDNRRHNAIQLWHVDGNVGWSAPNGPEGNGRSGILGEKCPSMQKLAAKGRREIA